VKILGRVSLFLETLTNKIMDETEMLSRVKELWHDSGLNKTEFAKSLGFDQSAFSKVLKGDRSISAGLINAILTKYNVSINWLYDGIGEKFVGENRTIALTQNAQAYYDSDFLLGFTEVMESPATTPQGYVYTLVGDKNCFWCNVSGHSMEPEIFGGDKVCLKPIVLEEGCFEFGKIYGIVTNNGIRTIKYVNRADDNQNIRLVPRNHDEVYGDYQDIPLKNVIQAFKVIATIRCLY
jgi:transcriptional regulator with XRE-family HTH domain